MSSFEISKDSSEAIPGRVNRAPLPWGRWGLRAIALTYLTVMLIIPLAVILQDGLREGLSGLWQQVTTPIAWSALKLTLWTSAVMTVTFSATWLMGLGLPVATSTSWSASRNMDI